VRLLPWWLDGGCSGNAECFSPSWTTGVIIGVRVVDVVLNGGACVNLHGKGRKL